MGTPSGIGENVSARVQTRHARVHAPQTACLALFSLNAFITLRLFHSDYIAQMPSIDGAFIGLARYIRDHFPDLTWMPLWYGGIPFPDCYPPLLHTLVAAVSGLGRIDIGLAYHAVVATLYSLGPVTLYRAGRRIGAQRMAAFLACVGYSLLSPAIWLGKELRHDIGGWFAPCRLDAMVRWGEGPHIASLTLLPLALGLMHVALHRRRIAWYFAAALAMAAVALSNWIGGMALALVAGAYLLAGFSAEWLPLWARMAAMAVWAYALAAPFVTPSTIATIMANAPLVASGYKANHLLQTAFLAGALLLALILWKARVTPRVRFGVLLLYLTGAITLCAYWFKLWIIPQPERYHLEMDMAFWLALALVAAPNQLPAEVGRTPWSAAGPPASPSEVSRKFLNPAGRSRQLGRGALWVRRIVNPPAAACTIILAALALTIAIHQHRRAQEIEKPIAIQSTVEYEISRWLGAHMPGQRVFAPGTIGFWMLAFSDTPMLTGGFDNGMRNTVLQDVNYQIYAGDRQDTMLAWLEAFGVSAVIGGGPDSREFYHPYAHPDKFAGLPELWRDGPDVIYPVPRRRASLAHAMLPSDLVAERPPAYYAKPLDHYLAALDDPSLPDATFEWRSTGAAAITGNFRPEQILSVQVAWDKGWNARVRGESRRVWQDKLGQMAIEPQCSGPCTVNLVYDGGIEQQAARWLSALAFVAGVCAIGLQACRFLRKRIIR
jgi:hypothetical protein